MTNSPQFDAAPLLSAKTELDAALGNAKHALQQYFADDQIAALHEAIGELQRVHDMLQGLALDGLVVYCGELGKLLQELEDGVLQVSPLQQGAANRALLELTHYLDALAQGASNAVLRLFNPYQEILQARGVETAFEVDLFFPELRVELPAAIRDAPRPADPAAGIKTARSQYQQMLLKWLRHEDVAGALQTMHAAVLAAMDCAPAGQRAFWWVAGGLLDCLIYDGLPSELNARKMLGRIDLQMKAQADGASPDFKATLSEMLYLLACSHTVSETVDEIKSRYALDDYLPGTQALPPGASGRVLEQMHMLLQEAEEDWEKCVREGHAVCAGFGELSAQLYALSEQLERNTLQFLCHQIQRVSDRAVDPERVQGVAMEVALALLLLNSGVERYGDLGSDFHEQARILARRMQRALMGQPQDELDHERLAQLQREAELRDARAPLAGEMQSNLRYVAQGLHAFFGNPERREELPQLVRLLKQVRGGLHMLSLGPAEQLLEALMRAVVHYADGANPSAVEESAIVAAIDALQACAQELASGQSEDESPLELALLDMHALQYPPLELLSPAAVAAVDEEEGELLEVFIEEAQDVLKILHANLENSRHHPESTEPLAVMRRGFHTLKGSGRMVGLNELGDIAWAVERAISKWLQHNKVSTPAILNFIARAESMFRGWVDTLKREGAAVFDGGELVALAQQFENGTEPPELREAGVPQTAEEPAEAAALSPEQSDADEASAGMVVGDITLSPTLFGIATEEAASHLAELRDYFTALRDSEAPVIPYDFMRAAHTLAGVNRTMGFERVADLAYAFELWLEERIDKPFTLSPAQLELLQQTLDTLDAMCSSIREAHQQPSPEPELIARLQAERKRVLPVPQRPPVVETELPQAPQPVEQRVVKDDIDEQLLPLLLEEADDLYPRIGDSLRNWHEQPQQHALGNSLQRLLHTLKGSARMAGVMRLGELTHRMEDRVVAAMSQEQPPAMLWQELENYFERIGSVLKQLRNSSVSEIMEEETVPPPEQGISAAMLRVPLDTIDDLVNEAGELSVARVRAETELRTFRGSLLELGDSVGRLRSQLREIEIYAESRMEKGGSLAPEMADKFDPLELDRFTRFQELTRFMNESVHDVQMVQHGLLQHLDEAVAALSGQAQLNRDLQHSLLAIRMLPLSSIGERLYRVVRQVAKELGKRANLELAGAELEMDRSVLERMVAPLEHLLRNAVAHGLESPAQREREGKPVIGEIRLALVQESNEVVFEFSDDGAGLDLDALRRRAAEMDILDAGKQLDDEQAMQLVFHSGLSTTAELTEISGRGVGMDVVRSEIAALGGRIDIDSERGRGTSFRIHLPLTLALTQVLMVRAGEGVYAIPAAMVEQVIELKADGLKTGAQSGKVDWQGHSYPLRYLSYLLGDSGGVPEAESHHPALLLRNAEQHMALQVDELLGNQEAVVKNVGPQLAQLPGIAGATVLGNGRVVLILNPLLLKQYRAALHESADQAVAAEPLPLKPLVMVVDDSLTMRKITSRMLSRAGYRAVTAKDGVDALEQLTRVMPAVILLDIEMPRMDGFEFTKKLRSDPGLKDLPIIMITSRSADKHRNYALELGVNAYFGKPYQEAELLQQIAAYAHLPEAG